MSSDTYADLRKLAEDLHRSRLFRTGSVEQALAVVLMGRELGIGPTTALTNIIISAGKPTLGAALVGALVQKSGRYRYVVTEMSDQKVAVDFFEVRPRGDEKLGTSVFSMTDAARARLGNSPTWQQYPRNLLLARALTNGARWYTPSVFGGAVYDPEELGVAGVGPVPVEPEVPGLAEEEPPDATSSVSAGNTVHTIEDLLANWSPDQIVAANGGNLPATDGEVEAVWAALRSRDVLAEPAGAA